MGGIRKSCYQCCKKHLGSAAAYVAEVCMGYPNYDLFVSGQLDHAATECYAANHDLAWCIRQHRINWENDHDYDIPWEALSAYISACEGADVAMELPADVLEGIDLDDKGKPVYDMDTRP